MPDTFWEHSFRTAIPTISTISSVVKVPEVMWEPWNREVWLMLWAAQKFLVDW